MTIITGTGSQARELYVPALSGNAVDQVWLGTGPARYRVYPPVLTLTESMTLPNGYLVDVASPRWTNRGTGIYRPYVDANAVVNWWSGTTDNTYSGNANHNTALFSDDMYVRATIARPLNQDRLFSNITLRVDSNYANYVGLDLFNGTARIITCINGTIVTRTNVAASISAGAVFELRAIGRAFMAYRSGSLISTWTDSTNLTALGPSNRFCGLGVQSQRQSFTNRWSAALSNWQAGEIMPY